MNQSTKDEIKSNMHEAKGIVREKDGPGHQTTPS
jgi:hypothetical protein